MRRAGPKVESTLEQVTQELVALWKRPFARLDWAGRVILLEDIDDELRQLLPDPVSAANTSSALTRGLINDLDLGLVTCLEQAYVYMNSADWLHRQSARVWLILNGRESSLVDSIDPANAAGAEKRKANRFRVDLESMISTSGVQAKVKLIEVSSSGAKLSMLDPLPPGTRISLDVPFLGRVEACIVWVTAIFVGLSFAVDQAMPLLT